MYSFTYPPQNPLTKSRRQPSNWKSFRNHFIHSLMSFRTNVWEWSILGAAWKISPAEQEMGYRDVREGYPGSPRCWGHILACVDILTFRKNSFYTHVPSEALTISCIESRASLTVYKHINARDKLWVCQRCPKQHAMPMVVLHQVNQTRQLPLEGFPRPWKFGSSLTIASGPQSSLPPNTFQTPFEPYPFFTQPQSIHHRYQSPSFSIKYSYASQTSEAKGWVGEELETWP
jgi:hypothetical protein